MYMYNRQLITEIIFSFSGVFVFSIYIYFSL